MFHAAYEDAYLRAVNDDRRPPRPNVIEQAKAAIGRDNYSVEPKGCYAVWEDGCWLRHLTITDFIRAANRRLKAQGLAQIIINPSWGQ